MHSLQSIVTFLFGGICRIPAPQRADALCSVFSGLLPEMSESDIAAAREQVIARFWGAPEISDAVVNLIDGHVALRELMDGSSPEDGLKDN